MEQKKKRRFRFPILVKTIVLILVLAAIVVEVSVAYYSIVMSNVNQDNYKMIANNLAETTAKVVNTDDIQYLKNEVKPKVDASEVKPTYEDSDPETIEQYLTQFDYLQEDPVFNRVRDQLRDIANANDDYADCVYLSYVDPVNRLFVYLCDSAPVEEACAPGTLDPIFDINEGVLEDPNVGFPAYITNTEEYGWLVTSGSPIKVGEEVIGFAMIDVAMGTVRAKQADSIVRLFLYLLITVNLIVAIGLIVVIVIFIRPIRKLNDLALSYDSDNPEATHEKFANLKIKTYDEVSDLSESIKKMEQDVSDRIKQLTLMNSQLATSREQTKKMTILANKDGLTGVQNKIAYDSEATRINEDIENGEEVRFGVAMIDLNYLKNTNDEYGHDAGDVVLIKLANIICNTFLHSPVYRVGGDEFVVLLRGKDYEKRELLINKFNKAIS